MNAGLLVDMPHLAETGAKSIGLFRTELQFMLASRFPRPGAQEKLYRAILEAAGRPACHLPHARHRRRQAPALYEGIRGGKPGARLARAAHRPRPPRASAHAVARLHPRAAGRDLRVMAPMVSTVEEFKTARALFERELAWSASHGYEPPRSVKLGVMVEVPSLLWQLDEIAACRRFSLRRLERSHAISLRRRSRQPAGRQSFRSVERRLPESPALDRRGRRASRNAGDAVRRDRRAAARSDGADGDRLPGSLDVGDVDRAGQGDDADAADLRDRARGRGDADRRGATRRRCASRCGRSPSASKCASSDARALARRSPFEFLTWPPTTISISSCAVTRKSARA